MNQETDYKRIFLAVFIAALIITGWQAFVEWPRRQHLAQYSVQQTKVREVEQAKQVAALPTADSEENPLLTHEQRLAASPRLTIASDTLHGSIALKGARFDDLTLSKYKETLEPGSPDVLLFSPNGDEDAYFAQIGWVSPDNKTKVPDPKSLWQSDKKTLTAGDTATLRWDNGEGVTFVLALTLDHEYMFNIAQRIENHSTHAVTVVPYAYINRAFYEGTTPKATTTTQRRQHTLTTAVHNGPLGVMTGALEETSYKELHEKVSKVYDNASGWFGISDQYWLSALIPGDANYKTTFSHYSKNDLERYQVDYLGQPLNVEPAAKGQNTIRLFAGAKVLKILDAYAKGNIEKHEPPIPLFDRSIDFGMLYFLTKPLLQALTFFYALVGNFGLAIMLLTVCVRLCLYPLANKSFKSMAQMRKLQPEMTKLRERHVDDQIALNKEMLSLYKREKVNPASGCLPVLLQMPVFIALYKVLYVSIEMRHAPFFGWLKDLSVADPSNLFTAFGMIPWEPPSLLHLGLLPMAYCATMIIQMKQQPKPADPVQAKMMGYMPYFLLFIFAKMPAGLVVYWTWSNLLSIIQQRFISVRHGDKNDTAKVPA